VQDFSNQKLRGKSFQGQDLSGANFTRADLRGANFKQANLSGANFTKAQFGLTPLHRGLQLLATAIAAILSGSFTLALSSLIQLLSTIQPPSLPLLLGFLAFLALITLRLGVEFLNLWLMRLLVILVILVSMILGGHPDWGNALTLIALAIAATVGLTQYIAIVVRCGEILAGKIESAAMVGLCVAASALMASQPIAGLIALGAIALGNIIAIDRDDAVIHAIAVALTTIGGTRLQQANLTNANFTQAQLGSTDLRQANITQTRFYQAERLEQARLGRSILRQAAVLRLLVTLDGRGRSFAEMDLSGANLRDADLTNADFTNANLDGSDLTGAKLSGTDLLPVNSIADSDSVFEVQMPENEAINPKEILASLMVLVRLAIADHNLEDAETQMLTEALQALKLPAEITLERLLDDRSSLDSLLKRITSPIIRERVYQSAYLMARIDGELEPEEEALLKRIQTQLNLSESTIENLQTAVSSAQDLSIADQIEAIIDPETRVAAVKTNIRLMSLMHAFSGAMPIPGFAIVTHLMIYKDQVELVQKIGRIWGYADDHKAPELNQVLFGSVGATAARVAISNVMLLIPVWGSVVGASTAFSMTWAIGELAQKFFAGEVDETTLQGEFEDAKALGQKVFQESQEAIALKQKEMAKLVQELQAGLQSGRLTQQDYMQQFRDRIGERLED
jgi:uncharacterized protein YjbI with pentapeptide repeats/uncharacterized protein (DUF697 family)/tellurite resistance protein